MDKEIINDCVINRIPFSPIVSIAFEAPERKRNCTEGKGGGCIRGKGGGITRKRNYATKKCNHCQYQIAINTHQSVAEKLSLE